MSDPENFLSRWSRRKREVLRENDTPAGLRGYRAANSSPPPGGEGVEKWGTSVPDGHDPPPQPSLTRGEGAAAARPAAAPPAGVPFDPASLPPIQSITAETDIRGFLGSGVPVELTRAALRLAWVCDPAIRNFVGLADYDWDFNAGDSIAGFGPLRMTDEVAEMAARVLDPSRPESGPRDPLDPVPKAEEAADEADTDIAQKAAAKMHSQAKASNQPVNEIGASPHSDELTHHDHVAVQYTSTTPEKGIVLVRRRHGQALPR